MNELSVLDHFYPTSFVSNNDKISTRLRVLSNDTLLKSARRFSTNIPSSQRTKTGLVKFIMDDFSRETKELIRLSTKELYKLASPHTDCPRVQLLLVCQLVHKRYGSAVAPLLLCEPTRWNPPKLMEDDEIVSSVNWLQVLIDGDHLKPHLSKVDLRVIKSCCNLYLSPDPTPKSKTGKYCAIAERFWSRLLFLFHISDIEFFKNYFSLFPYSLPTHEASRCQLVEGVLREEFGCEVAVRTKSPLLLTLALPGMRTFVHGPSRFLRTLY